MYTTLGYKVKINTRQSHKKHPQHIIPKI